MGINEEVLMQKLNQIIELLECLVEDVEDYEGE